MYRRKDGFTLIELLIVVAIIAILALIAVPNFLEAQTRAKVSRVHADFRSLATAIEAYCVDWNSYPWKYGSFDDPECFVPLSTPVAYITNPVMRDPFRKGGQSANIRPDPDKYLVYVYIPFHFQGAEVWSGVDEKFDPPAFPLVLGHDLANNFPGPFHWIVCCYGPDFSMQFDNADPPANLLGIDAYMPYDPTNGSVSLGDIYRIQ